MTDLEQEREVQDAWRPRPGQDVRRLCDRLMAEEFLPEDKLNQRRGAKLKTLIAFARSQTPYYAEKLDGLDRSVLSFDNPAALAELPVLTKADVHLRRDDLVARQLPPGHEIVQRRSSSGTTGPPAVVYHSTASAVLWPLHKQREYRWFRFDPSGVMASIRTPGQIPQVSGSRDLELGEGAPFPHWPNVGPYFETGESFGFNCWNPVDDKRDWLNALEPDYLTTYPETMEHIAFAAAEVPLVKSFKGLHGISEMMTPDMARRIERAFETPVDQNYGLSEIGVVAVKCREGGRYHVHDEFAVVEIVDEDGRPVAPGETGRLLVTCLENLAMPLIRYDTGDLATALSGDCPCGRTLPSFGAIVGRYYRIAFLPDGTFQKVYVLRDAFETMTEDVAAPLRMFQVQHYRDDSFELRLVATRPLSDALVAHFFEAWEAALGPEAPPLRVVQVDDIPRGPGGKFHDFMSEFFPSPDDQR